MKSSDLTAQLKDHPFFEDMSDAHITTLSSCSKKEAISAGSQIFNVGESANKFFVILEGQIAVDLQRQDGPPVTIQTVSGGDVLGWSWLFAPHEWLFGARAVSDCKVIVMDAHCLRSKCDSDTALGYDLLLRFSAIVVSRLRATRMQLLDMFKNE